MPEDTVNVRYMVDDVDTAVGFYVEHFGFAVRFVELSDPNRGRIARTIERLLVERSRHLTGGWTFDDS